MSDLDLGMNQWITRKFEYPADKMDRGRVLWEADLDAYQGAWGRYKDLEGDGIPWRTVMGIRTRALHILPGELVMTNMETTVRILATGRR